MSETVFSRTNLAQHILRAMSVAQRDGLRVDLEGLSVELGARRADVRGALSTLHQQGLVNVLKMRLTLAGFALGTSFANRPLAPVRAQGRVQVVKAA